MKRTIVAVAIAASVLIPATHAGAGYTDLRARDGLGAVLLDVAETVTGVDLGAVLTRGLLDDLVDSANFVVALQRAERAPDLLEVEPESGTVEVPGHGEIVSTVARCAPRGRDARGLFTSMRNHGAFVTVAAQGGTIDLDVPAVSGEGAEAEIVGTETVTVDLSTPEGAELLCRTTDLIQQAANRRQAVDGADGAGHGPPDHAARPDHARKPDHAGAGKPDHAGKPGHATGRSGKPHHAGEPSDSRGGED